MGHVLAAANQYLAQCRSEKKEPSNDSVLLQVLSKYMNLLFDGDYGNNGPRTTIVPLEKEGEFLGCMTFEKNTGNIFYETQHGIAKINLLNGSQVELQPGSHAFANVPFASPDGRFIASRDDFVRISERDSGKLVMQLSWERYSSEACTVNVVFSPDVSLVAVSYAYDNAVRVWSLKENTYLGEYRACNHEGALAFSPDNELLLIGSKTGVDLFHVPSKLRVFQLKSLFTDMVSFNTDGTSFAFDCHKNKLYIVDIASLNTTTIRTWEGFQSLVDSNTEFFRDHENLELQNFYYNILYI